MSRTEEQHLLTEAEAADYLHDIPPGTLRQWRHLGRGPAYVRLGRHVRYRPEDLDAFIQANRVEREPKGAA